MTQAKGNGVYVALSDPPFSDFILLFKRDDVWVEFEDDVVSLTASPEEPDREMIGPLDLIKVIRLLVLNEKRLRKRGGRR